jgi:hypothetical protein
MSVKRPSLLTLRALLAVSIGLIALGGDAGAQGTDADAFDRDAASTALKSVNIARCKKPKGPTGDGHVIVTFAPRGSASDVVVDQAPFAGTKVGKCIAGEYRKVKVPPFTGAAVSVGKKFKIE